MTASGGAKRTPPGERGAERSRTPEKRRRPRPTRTSALLREIVREPWTDGAGAARADDVIRVGALIRRVNGRAIGLSLLVFALPICAPAPPGLPALCGAVLLWIALRMIAGFETPGLPRVVSRREVSRAAAGRLVDRVAPWLERLERVSHARFGFMTGRAARRGAGVMIAVLAVIVLLPIPVIGNIAPGIAATVIALGLMQRDGLMVIVGLALGAAAIAVNAGLAWAALAALGRLSFA